MGLILAEDLWGSGLSGLTFIKKCFDKSKKKHLVPKSQNGNVRDEVID